MRHKQVFRASALLGLWMGWLGAAAACGSSKNTSGPGKFAKTCTMPASADTAPATLYETGCFSTTSKPASRLLSYSVNAALWADEATKTRWLAPNTGQTATLSGEGVLQFAAGAGVFKEFYRNDERLETRLLFVNAAGAWEAVSYAWNAKQTEATLVPAGGQTRTDADGSTWTYSPRTTCMYCHNDTAGTLLGVRLAELSRVVDNANQLQSMQTQGVLPESLPDNIVAWPAFDGDAPLADRARSYLASNCSFCHRPNGASGTKVDFRYDTPLQSVNVCDVAPSFGQIGAQEANILTPGSPDLSVMSLRMHSIVQGQRMPPVGHVEVDVIGTTLVDGWITGLTECPATDPNGA